jgi:hypothetical protein
MSEFSILKLHYLWVVDKQNKFYNWNIATESYAARLRPNLNNSDVLWVRFGIEFQNYH